MNKTVDHNNHLNFFRLLFALQVVYMHSSGWLELPKGGVMFDFLALFPGVPLFFMVSGFLITDSFLNSGGLKEYFVKRGLRIYPALALNILILELAMYIGGNIMGSNISIIQYIIFFFTYVATAASGIGTTVVGIDGATLYNFDGFFQYYPSGVLWTLTVELSFYLVLPFILLFKNAKVRNSILVILFVLAIGISMQASKEFYSSTKFHMLLHISVFPYMWIFIIGMVMRLYWDSIKKYFLNYGLYYLGFYLVYSFVVIVFFDGFNGYKIELDIVTVIQTILMACAMFSMAFSYTHIKFNRKLDLSYSTYLYHMLIVQILIGFGITGSGYLYFVVIGVTFAIAYLSWTYVEKPMLKLKRVNK